MTNKTLKAWGARAALSFLLPIVIGLGLCALIAVFMAVASFIPAGTRVDRQWIFLGAFIAAVGLSLLSAIVFAVVVITRRARHLDRAFEPLGISGQMHLINGRQYHGQFGGRQVDAYFYRGPAFDLYLHSPLKTRVGVGTRDTVGLAVAGMLKRQPIQLDDPDLQHLGVFPADEIWAREWLTDPEVKDIVLRLTKDEGALELRQVHVQPDAILLRLYRTRTQFITPENVRQWLDDLTALARLSEALSPPANPLEPTKLELNSRANRNAFLLPAFGLTCGIVLVTLVCAAVPLAIFLFNDLR